MSVQTTYSVNPAIAFAGQKADNSSFDVDSMISTDTSSIPFGVFVASDSASGAAGDQSAKMPAASGAVLMGVLMHSFDYARTWTDPSGTTHGELDSTGLKAGAHLNVMRRGRIYVTSETAAAVGDPVHVRYSANGGNTQLGAVRNAADAGHTIDMTGKARYVSTCSASGLAVIELDMTNA